VPKVSVESTTPRDQIWKVSTLTLESKFGEHFVVQWGKLHHNQGGGDLVAKVGFMGMENMGA
jgi:hypothetical protein